MPKKAQRKASASVPKRGMMLVAPFIIVTCVSIAGWWVGRFVTSSPQEHVSRTAPVSDRRDFSLVDTLGQRVSLDTYRDKWLLVFFGFTTCPEACPTTLLKLQTALRDIGPAVGTIQPIFITLDPERDQPENLKGYLANFGEGIAGLSGSLEDVAAAARAYGVYFAKRPTDGGDYTIDHSTALYLVAPDGKLIRAFSLTRDLAEFVRDLSTAMASRT